MAHKARADEKDFNREPEEDGDLITTASNDHLGDKKDSPKPWTLGRKWLVWSGILSAISALIHVVVLAVKGNSLIEGIDLVPHFFITMALVLVPWAILLGLGMLFYKNLNKD